MEGGELTKTKGGVPSDAEIYADLDTLARTVASVTEKIAKNEAAKQKSKGRRQGRGAG